MFQQNNSLKELRDAVWAKAKVVDDVNEARGFRKDRCGAWIKYPDYGDRSSETNYGWEIDHIIPQSEGGTDDISNLQPLHWMNNVSKSDNYPFWSSAVTSSGNHNVKL